MSTLTVVLTSLLFSTVIDGESIQPRDPYIVCPGNTVPDHARGLPHGYSLDAYPTVMSLCSALNGNRRNVGCFCTSSQESSFHCNAGVADPVLYHAVITSSLKPFPAFCADSCFCTDAEVAEMDRSMSADDHLHTVTDPMQQDEYFDPNDASLEIHQHGSEPWGGYRQIPGDEGNGWDDKQTLNRDATGTKTAVAHGQCWTNCTSQADCSMGGEKGCMCSTKKEQYQPGSGTVAFVAACIISMSGVGGKREEMRPCPCNSTYVSRACCGVTDGLVWEDERLKLGELIIKHEL